MLWRRGPGVQGTTMGMQGWRGQKAGSSTWSRSPTCTDDTGILAVGAVVHAPSVVSAEQQGGLVPTAPQVVQEDVAAAGAEASVAWGGYGRATAQLAAHHLRLVQVPEVVAHRPPAASVPQLHAALAAVPAAGQPQVGTWDTAR